MGNAYRKQFWFSRIPGITSCFGNITIGATGAVSSFSAPDVATSGITRLTTGIYTIKFNESFGGYMGFNWNVDPGVTGSAIAAGSLVTGTQYQITTLGTTTQANWVTAGLNTNYTAAVGVPFTAVGTTSGNGTATAVSKSSVASIEVVNPTALLRGTNPGTGALMTIQTLDFANALVDPADGSVIYFEFIFKNSSLPSY